jgi:hypothetical protein
LEARVGGLKTGGTAATLAAQNSTGGKSIIHIKHGLSRQNICKTAKLIRHFAQVSLKTATSEAES